MTTAEPAGSPNGGTLDGKFAVGSGGFSSPYKAMPSSRRRVARDSSTASSAAGASRSPTPQMLRRPSENALPHVLFNGSNADPNTVPPGQQPPGRSSPVSNLNSRPSYLGLRNRTEAQNPVVSQHVDSRAQPGPRTSFVFTVPPHSPPAVAAHVPPSPLQQANAPSHPSTSPSFSYFPASVVGGGPPRAPTRPVPSAEERPATGKDSQSDSTSGESSTGLPQGNAGFSQPLLSRQFAGVQLGAASIGSGEQGRAQTLAGRMAQQASLNEPIAENMTARFAASISMIDANAASDPRTKPAPARLSKNQLPVGTPERTRVPETSAFAGMPAS